MIIGAMRPEEARVFDQEAGYHIHSETSEVAEIFWLGGSKPGWYWKTSDGFDHGPFGTSTRALRDFDEDYDG